MKKSEIQLPALFSDNMVMQRDKPLRVWGEATEEIAKVRITLGEASAEAEIIDGHFMAELPPQPASVGLNLAIFANEETDPQLILRNVALGDVYLACGQSNMEYFLRYDAHWQDIRESRPDPDIRMFNVPRISFEGSPYTHAEDSGFWFIKGHPALDVFSAPGYTFARELKKHIDIPFGIIGCNWGGTPACAWIEESYLRDEPLNVFMKEYEAELAAWDPDELREASLKGMAFENSYRHELEWRVMMYGLSYKEQLLWMKEHAKDPVFPVGPYHHYRPCGLYHTMIETIAPFAAKGILWYQGESDSGHAEIYDQTMKALIQCFRDTFRDPALPFLFVQLAPFERWLDCTGDDYPAVRRSQDIAAHAETNAWMTCIMDIGDKDDIHPKRKQEVGERLALLARGHVYGEDILCDPPEFNYASWDGRVLRLHFLHAEGGLLIGENAAACLKLETSCQDGVPDGSPAVIRRLYTEDDTLCVELLPQDQEHDQLSFSFAEAPYCEVRIWNQAHLPVKPFHGMQGRTR
ncbi:MAG: hypothetical protein IJ899_15970 [Blautia sp.]|nr:hypothetical protein [Blautia sp.]